MAYQAIYRKWRPTTFEDVVGQSHITDTLKTEIKTNRLAHAYLFCGTRGTGKTTTAKILSRAVNCESPLPNGNPCNECASCKGILSNTIMDIVEIDAASNNGVENIRELRDEISYTPANVKYKIYIIDEVHMLSTSAFNALLKTLEEPPAHAIFILATTEPQKIPATIQSRCQRFDFRRISAKNIAGRIGEITRKDGINITQDAIQLVAELGDGSMRDALSVLDLCSGIEGEITRQDIENVTGSVNRTALIDLAVALINSDISSSLTLIGKIIDSGKEIGNLIDELIMCIREMLVCKIVDNPSDIVDKSPEDIEKYKTITNSVAKDVLLYIVKVLSETTALCKTSTNPRVILEASAIKICDPSTDASTEAFAARLGKIEAMIATGKIPSAPVVVEQPVSTVELVEENVQEVCDTPPFDVSEETVEDAPPFSMDENKPDDDEEYVSEAGDYIEEDFPPFNMEQIAPIPENAPPFDMAPTEDAIPFKEEELPPVAEPKNIDVNSIADTLSKINIALSPMLRMSKIQVRDGIHYVVTQEIFKNTMSNDKDFTESLKGILNAEHLKYVTEAEFDGTDTKDPLEDIISMAGDVDQISIF
ncbi:MAG: DNA polymerase III subunit gamma/tau [Clostridia bacterium]|nr:DNA polymerase III subunit gamma/tau [Clostridia bacterium]